MLCAAEQLLLRGNMLRFACGVACVLWGGEDRNWCGVLLPRVHVKEHPTPHLPLWTARIPNSSPSHRQKAASESKLVVESSANSAFEEESESKIVNKSVMMDCELAIGIAVRADCGPRAEGWHTGTSPTAAVLWMFRSEIAALEMPQGADPGARAPGRLSRQGLSVVESARAGLAPQRVAISCRYDDLSEGQLVDALFEDGGTGIPILGSNVTAGGAGRHTALPAAIEPARAPTCSSNRFGGLCRVCLRPHGGAGDARWQHYCRRAGPPPSEASGHGNRAGVRAGARSMSMLGQGTDSSPPDLRAAGPTTSWGEAHPPTTDLSHGWG